MLVAVSCTSASSQLSTAIPADPLVRADGEVFAAIVADRIARSRSAKEKGDTLWFDARPYGEPTVFRDVAGGGTGAADATLFPKGDSSFVRAVIENRRMILSRMGVGEGGAFSYPKCGGMLRPPPPPSAPSTTQPSDCPSRGQEYLNVGISVKGVPERLKNAPILKEKPIDLTGELFTVAVNSHGVGPGGQGWFQSAYLLKRNPATQKLEVLATVLLSWAE